MKVLIMPCERPLRNGNRNPRGYPYWDKLKELLSSDGHTIEEITGIVPLKELEKIIEEYDIIITIDSFFQHFCWYHGKQAFTIWGVSDPLIFGHKENINILKDRKYLRPFQYDVWENVVYDESAFTSPEEVYRIIMEHKHL
ncbi:hypothetical protein D4R86_00420 [bacterium]|nr:MAG: hypothetical protein D4R86_00420 [bacterium]